MVKIRIQGWDDSDLFSIGAFGFTPEDEEADPDYCRSAPDFDDFDIPGILLPKLIGEFGAPSELIGRVFTVELP